MSRTHSTLPKTCWMIASLVGAALLAPQPILASGWFGDGTSTIAVVRPTSFVWYLTTASGACPPGFAFAPNSDGTSMCQAQFGLFGDVPLLGYFSQSTVIEVGVWRPSDGRLYFQPAHGQCPSGSANQGRLASGAVYCSMATVVKAGMSSFEFRRSGKTSLIGAWNPTLQTWTLPRTSATCPAGTSRLGALCELQFGHRGITPRVVDYDGDGNDDIGYYDPRGGAHHFIPSRRRCPQGADEPQGYGAINGAVKCRLAPSSGRISVTPGDYDGDRIPDVLNYDVSRRRFYLVPTAKACPWYFIPTRNDSRGRATCVLDLGGFQDLPSDGGDYDGDGRFDPVLINEATFVWTIVPSSGNCPVTTTPIALPGKVACQRQFGLPGDLPIS